MDELLLNELARKIWDYHHLNQKLEKADCILVMGSHDIRVAERGAELYLKGWAPLIIFSGGIGRLTTNLWHKREADKFAKIALEMGVPKNKILIENNSSNTSENITFTRQLLENKGLKPRKIIVVQKPYMERRAYATFCKVWPEIKVIVTSPQISYEKYPTKNIPKDQVINIMVGDLQRIKLYFEKGFQIYQEIPSDVWQAYEQLVKLGYNKHLIRQG